MRKRVGTDSLVDSALTYSAVGYGRPEFKSQLEDLCRSSHPLSLPLLLSVNSKLSCHHKEKKWQKKEKGDEMTDEDKNAYSKSHIHLNLLFKQYIHY